MREKKMCLLVSGSDYRAPIGKRGWDVQVWVGVRHRFAAKMCVDVILLTSVCVNATQLLKYHSRGPF